MRPQASGDMAEVARPLAAGNIFINFLPPCFTSQPQTTRDGWLDEGIAIELRRGTRRAYLFFPKFQGERKRTPVPVSISPVLAFAEIVTSFGNWICSFRVRHTMLSAQRSERDMTLRGLEEATKPWKSKGSRHRLISAS